MGEHLLLPSGCICLYYNHVCNISVSCRGYKPPEFIDKQVISIKSDIYSLGIIIIEIMTGTKYDKYSEFSSSQEFIQHVREVNFCFHLYEDQEYFIITKMRFVF